MNKRNMVISLIGRPNVGKSSIFNSIMKKQNKALTHDRPGVTRDRHYGIAKFDELGANDPKEAIIVDTGGFYPDQVEENQGSEQEKNANHFFNIMTEHAQLAIEESDLVLFVVDIREGILPFDQSIADYIRTTKTPFWLLINKFDTDKQIGHEAEFYSLGVDYDDMFMVSAAHGKGLINLREKLHQKLIDFSFKQSSAPALQKGVTPSEQVVTRLSIIGAPNAGKSTLLNQLIGAQRALVSNIPGTTVDPIEGYFDIYFGKEAGELKGHDQSTKNDHVLFTQYDEFRKNNPDVYTKIYEAYNREEHFHGDLQDEHLDDDHYDEKYDEKDYDIEKVENREEILFDQAFTELEVEPLESDNEEIENIENKEEEEGSYWRSIHLVDTAGIRRRKAINDHVEEQSVYRSLRCITEADIVIYMIDATKGIRHQDCRLLDIALEKGKSVIVCLNKMDLMNEKFKSDRERQEWIANLRIDIPWLDFCDIVPISAKANKGLKGLKNSIKKTTFIRHRSLPTAELNRFIFDVVERNPVIARNSGGKHFKVKYTSMIKSAPPTFLFFTNKSRGIPESYRRYLKNSLRTHFTLDNTPIHLLFRTGSELQKRMKKVVPDSFTR